MEFDLFGAAIDPGTGKPGRPKKVATHEDRNKVKVLLAMGATVEEMCLVVRMSEPTFRRNFFGELRERHAQKLRLRARMLEALVDEALEKRNMGAMKQLRQEVEKSEMAGLARKVAGDRLPEDADRPRARPMPQGKKDAAVQAAERLLENNPLLQPGIPDLLN